MPKTLKFILSVAILGSTLGSVALAEGDYYVGISRDASAASTSLDSLRTGSIDANEANAQELALVRQSTRRDNRQMGDDVSVDSGDYYRGANRPN